MTLTAREQIVAYFEARRAEDEARRREQFCNATLEPERPVWIVAERRPRDHSWMWLAGAFVMWCAGMVFLAWACC